MKRYNRDVLFLFERLAYHPEYSKDRSLKAALYDAMYFSIMLGLGETYLSTFAIALGGSPLQIGMLASVPPLIGAIMQLWGLSLFRAGVPRKTMIVIGAGIHGITWAAASMLAFGKFTGAGAVWFLVGVAIWQQITANVIGPAWNSLIGDLVPPKVRARYFGYRNQISGWLTVGSMILGGWVLSSFRYAGSELWGFGALFAVAALARLASAHWLQGYEEPGYSVEKKDQFSLWDFVRRSPRSNFAKFVFFFALMNGAASVAGPYVSLYMLRDLKMTYWEFSIISAVQLVTQYVFMRNWGAVVDEFGSRRILTVCATGVCFSTLLLLVDSSFWYLIFVQMFSGLFWAGFGLAASNFMFDAVTPQKRAQCAAYMSIVNSGFVFIGAYIGSLLISSLPPDELIGRGIFTPESIYLKVFLISCSLRAIVVVTMLPKFREVREVSHVHTRELMFRVSNVRPIAGATFSMLAEAIKLRRRD